MNQIPHLDARVNAMQQEFIGQISQLSARLAVMASELAAAKEELKEATEAKPEPELAPMAE